MKKLRFDLPVTRAMWVAVITVWFFFSLSGVSSAQLNLSLRQIVNNWPTIEITYRATWNGQPWYINDKSLFRIEENGIEIDSFDLITPPPEPHKGISTALLFDASSNMGIQNLAKAQSIAHYFISLFEIPDESAIMEFKNVPLIRQSMTTDTTLLHNSIDAITASGSAALWDGIYSGIQALDTTASNSPRLLLVFTNGNNTAGVRTKEECIALAKSRYIRVYTFGYGSSVNETDLRAIANQTYGDYQYEPATYFLHYIYTTNLPWTPDQTHKDSFILYNTKCPDGAQRTVDITLKTVWGGSVTKSMQFKALKDTTTFTPLRIKLGGATVRGNSAVKIPLQLVDPILNQNFYPSTFTIVYNKAQAQFISLNTPGGSMLSGVPFDVKTVPEGVQIQFKERRAVNGSGLLAEIEFKASDPEGADTVKCSLALSKWTFEQGCFYPVLTGSTLNIIPRQVLIACGVNAPKELKWVNSALDYSPNPFSISMQITNNGDRESRNGRFRIIYNKNDIQLISPAADTVQATPPNLDPGKGYNASWLVRANRRLAGDSVRISIVASFDNHPDVVCSTSIWAPQSGPFPECSISAPGSLTWSKDKFDYEGNPIELGCSVKNTGGGDLKEISFTLHADAKDFDVGQTRVVPGSPYHLAYGKQSDAKWFLRARPRVQRDSVTVGFTAKFANAPDVTCDKKIWIPKAEVALLCAISSPLIGTDAERARHIPMPFKLEAQVQNLGITTSDTVYATITLPPEITLAGGSSATHRVTPAILKTGETGTVSWQLYHPPTETSRMYFVNVRMQARSDSSLCSAPVEIPGLYVPQLETSCSAPDSLVYNDISGDYPLFDVSVTAWNQGQRSFGQTTATLVLPSDFVLADTTEPLTKVLSSELQPYQPGDPKPTVSWRLRALGKSNLLRLRPVTFEIAAFDTVYGSPHRETSICAVFIKGVQSKFACVASAALGNPDSLLTNPTGTAVTPNPFTWRAAYVNSGANSGTISTVQIILTDPQLSLDPSTPAFLAPNKRVDPGDTAFFSWIIHIENRLASRRPVLSIEAVDDLGTSIVCDESVGIPGVLPWISCALASQDTVIRYDSKTGQYNPSSWTVTASLKNDGEVNLTNVEALLEFTNPVSPPLVEFDPAFPDNTNPKIAVALLPGQSSPFSWGVRLANPNTTPLLQTIPFVIRYRSTEITSSSVPCEVNAHVESIVTSVKEHSPPARFSLVQNYPNPVTSSTVIEYELPSSAHVLLGVYDAFGRMVRQLTHERKNAGRHLVSFDTDGLPNGVYVYRLEAAGKILTRHLVVIK